MGRNNKQNDKLTLKEAAKLDLWLHTHEIPGSHVILETAGKEPSEQTILEAAQLAAYHSKAKESAQVPVDYCLVKFVKKPVGAKPGKVIFSNYKTVYVTPQAGKERMGGNELQRQKPTEGQKILPVMLQRGERPGQNCCIGKAV